MRAAERIYRRTGSGAKACASDASGLATHYRKILRLIESDTHFAVVRNATSEVHQPHLVGWMEQLETLGFVESRPAGKECELDFTVRLVNAREAIP